jgi:hypothetical protein
MIHSLAFLYSSFFSTNFEFVGARLNFVLVCVAYFVCSDEVVNHGSSSFFFSTNFGFVGARRNFVQIDGSR